jgi:hypothetical protein
MATVNVIGERIFETSYSKPLLVNRSPSDWKNTPRIDGQCFGSDEQLLL